MVGSIGRLLGRDERFRIAVALILAMGNTETALAALTNSQQRVINAIHAHCKPLHDQFVQSPSSLSSGEQAWAQSCWGLETTYNYLTGQTFNPRFLLPNINNLDQLGRALEQSSQFKPLTQGRAAIESASGQFAALGARMEALRLGATGFNLANLNAAPGTRQFALSRPGVRGGAAGDGGLLDNRLGFFVNGDFVFGSRDQTGRQEAFDFNNNGVTGGVDYRFSDDFVLGLAGRYTAADIAMVDHGGDLTADNYALSSYATYYRDDFHLDGIFAYQWSDYLMNRRIVYPTTDSRSFSSTTGRQFALSLGGGYDFHFGALTVTPDVRAQYVRAEIGAYDEAGSEGGHDMHVTGQTVKSLITTFGGKVSYAISTAFGVLTPHLRMVWNHEFENDTRSVNAWYRFDGEFRLDGTKQHTVFGLLTDSPDRNYATFDAGIAGQFAHGIAGFINYATLFGLSYSEVHSVNAGVRVEF